MTSSVCERYVAAMVLSGVGDALGYKNGEWEFCHSGETIYAEVLKLNDVENIQVKLPGWMVSDDTVMHLATGEALVNSSKDNVREDIFVSIATSYKLCMREMAGRAPGITCINGAHQLKPLRKDGYRIPFNPRGGGCGGAMRSMCIGLRYPRPENLEDLIAVSIESGRMTHNNPVGYLGSLASALFTSYAIQERPLNSWGRGLLDCLPLAMKYIESTNHCVQESKDTWSYFVTAWENYLKSRGIADGKSDVVFPQTYGFKERDKFVKKVSYDGFGGASGHDAPMIAYDALLGAGDNWKELCYRSMFHGGDSDSTGVIAACCFGALYGFKNVPSANHMHVEFRQRLEDVGNQLYQLAYPQE
ncbi:ADP-ribosylhydrolase ARH1-like [Physella acuta]|uniref:ADP-ribosylhydrolase ARH1-like n=1 Tax=Physella acuta TaxID=109671 RepID=UPI0027DB9716|nr:ADP-ribosylhydrolase ARH1-like [Physella acuta]XP_059157147.1 ADP-ribosylhydrolase ARH1-like [Physella acuta]XP_059157148.1 ADP-ribosylhydrolase ARH1-like [Physella acuta]XP_059157149.1 ADP-ribosylhydrolase ARH1-like [Physella acuta]XP_059157150.1 ADP-ribosylhydrolase ARH1-like [Physella acuta]XP_059157151.1 ADP-ribosylhydrolase ARH1-like [Physella acuta]XP_059157152.1 ADP-ribosylhydrolase ARH1-like [Physella acuta]